MLPFKDTVERSRIVKAVIYDIFAFKYPWPYFVVHQPVNMQKEPSPETFPVQPLRRIGHQGTPARQAGISHAIQAVNFLPSAAMRSSSGEIVKFGPISGP